MVDSESAIIKTFSQLSEEKKKKIESLEKFESQN